MGTGLRLGVVALLASATVLVLLAAGRRHVERRDRGGPAPPATPAAAADTAAGSEGAPGAAEPAKPSEGPSAEELTAALLAAYAKGPVDWKHPLVALLRKRSEAEVLRVAAALLACGHRAAEATAWDLVAGVLQNDKRRITDDAAYAMFGGQATRSFEEGDPPTNQMVAARVLALLGTPAAVETLLRKFERGDWAAQFALPRVKSPASVPLLSAALGSAPEFRKRYIASALANSAEGRAELRRLLDPATGFDWTRDGAARVAAFTILGTHFRDAADLAALDAVLRDRPALAPHLDAGWFDYSARPKKSVQVRAIMEFLPGHPGSPLEETLLPMLDYAQRKRLEEARGGLK